MLRFISNLVALYKNMKFCYLLSWNHTMPLFEVVLFRSRSSNIKVALKVVNRSLYCVPFYSV